MVFEPDVRTRGVLMMKRGNSTITGNCQLGNKRDIVIISPRMVGAPMVIGGFYPLNVS